MKKLLLAAAVVSLAMPMGVFARENEVEVEVEDGGVRVKINAERDAIKADIKADREALKDEAEKLRDEAKEEFKANREAIKEEFKQLRTESSEKNELLRAELKAKIEASRAALKTRMEEARAKLKTRLEMFKDERKASTTARIAENLDKVNQNLVGAVTKQLDALSAIVARTEDKIGTSSTVQFAADVAAAKARIAEADAAVTAQAAKNYSVTVSSEATVKADVQAVRDTLRKDWEAVKTKVEAAKTATRKVVGSVKSMIKTDDDSASSTAN
jgi:hypothetical protein